jgi:hypothetical protein
MRLVGALNRRRWWLFDCNGLLFDQCIAGCLHLRKWPLSYSFFREAQIHFLPSLSGRSPVNWLPVMNAGD